MSVGSTVTLCSSGDVLIAQTVKRRGAERLLYGDRYHLCYIGVEAYHSSLKI